MEVLTMPMGKGYGKPVKKSKTKGTAKKLMAKNPKMPRAVAKAISKNMRKK